MYRSNHEDDSSEQRGAPSLEPDLGLERQQITLKTVFTVCFGVLFVVALVAAFMRALLVLSLTAVAVMLAVALNHPVTYLQRRGLRRGSSIAITVSLVLILVTTLAGVLIPPAVEQARALVARAPEILESFEHTQLFRAFEHRLGLSEWLSSGQGSRLPELLQGTAAPLLSAVTSLLRLVAGSVTVLFLTVFILFFGAPLVEAALGEALAERREMYRGLLDEIYSSLGGYLGGLIVICSINATLTTIFLAINGVPYFLPLGIVSGFSSLVPYAGPAVVGASISLLTAVNGGVWHGLASVIYFVVYGQLEGNVLAPQVFRRAIHMNPLVALWSVLFFGELAGVVGAIAAVPAAAALQLVLREVLRVRREHLRR